MNTRSAMTLVELTVAIVVVIILLSVIFFGWILPGAHSRAQRVSCVGNQKQIITTASTYAE